MRYLRALLCLVLIHSTCIICVGDETFKFKMELVKTKPIELHPVNYFGFLDPRIGSNISYGKERKIDAPDGFKTLSIHLPIYEFKGHIIEFCRVIPIDGEIWDPYDWRTVVKIDNKIDFLIDHINGKSVDRIIQFVIILLEGKEDFRLICFAKEKSSDGFCEAEFRIIPE